MVPTTCSGCSSRIASRSRVPADAVIVCSGSGVEVDVFVYRHRFQPLTVQRCIENCLSLSGVEATGQVGAELGLQQRDAVVAPAPVADRILHTSSSRTVPSFSSTVSALAIERLSGSW